MDNHTPIPGIALIPVKTAAAMVHCSVRHFQRIVKLRKVRSFRIGRSTAVSLADVEELQALLLDGVNLCDAPTKVLAPDGGGTGRAASIHDSTKTVRSPATSPTFHSVRGAPPGASNVVRLTPRQPKR